MPFVLFLAQTRHALKFFRDQKIPFWKMEPYFEPAFRGRMVLADRDRNIIVMYLPNTHKSMPQINLYGLKKTRYSIRWYNPRTGGRMFKGSVANLNRGVRQNTGQPPGGKTKKDWVVLFRRTRGVPKPRRRKNLR